MLTIYHCIDHDERPSSDLSRSRDHTVVREIIVFDIASPTLRVRRKKIFFTCSCCFEEETKRLQTVTGDLFCLFFLHSNTYTPSGIERVGR